MTFLLNQTGSRQWAEIEADELRHIVEPMMGMPVDHTPISWIDEAEHGQIVLLGDMRIVCVDLSEDAEEVEEAADGVGEDDRPDDSVGGGRRF